MNSTTETTTGFTKDIQYDAITRDFCALVNGQILGWASTYLKAQELCNEYVYEALRRGNVDAADLTPEDAADVLTALTQVEADTQAQRDAEQAAYAAALKAEAQRVFEAEEARAGVEETLPRAIYHQFAGLLAEIEPNGTAALYLPGNQRVNLDADSTYELYLFFAKLPGVGPLLERLHFARQAADEAEYEQDRRRDVAIVRLMAEMEPDARKRIETNAYEEGRKAGQAQAVSYLKQTMTKRAA